MRNVVVSLRFLGTNYHGFQRQENAYTVQQAVEEAIFAVTGEKTVLYGCSRTDAGVHAYDYCAMFELDRDIPDYRVVSALNAHLPQDIAVLSAYTAEEGFHPRFSAKGKEYIYIIHNSRIRDPFLNGRSYHYYYSHIDEKMLCREAQDFVGTHDFASFCAAGSSVSDTVRTVSYFEVERDGENIYFKVAANGFLYNMVRIMVGTLIQIHENKIPQGAIPGILEKKDRSTAGITAVPQGLYLNRIFY